MTRAVRLQTKGRPGPRDLAAAQHAAASVHAASRGTIPLEPGAAGVLSFVPSACPGTDRHARLPREARRMPNRAIYVSSRWCSSERTRRRALRYGRPAICTGARHRRARSADWPGSTVMLSDAAEPSASLHNCPVHGQRFWVALRMSPRHSFVGLDPVPSGATSATEPGPRVYSAARTCSEESATA